MIQRLGRRPGEPLRVIDHGPASAHAPGSRRGQPIGGAYVKGASHEPPRERDRKRGHP